jgi:D-sedoheptulose 7-phosphate isomerase
MEEEVFGKQTNINFFKKQIEENFKIKKKILKDFSIVSFFCDKIYSTLKNNNKIFICGNGGSAADAQHLSAEFLIRLNPKVNRRPYPIISLALDTSTITACANDYDFKYIFSRPLEAIANKGDLLIVISTSGNSKNIIEVLKKSKKIGVSSIAFLGNGGGKALKLCNKALVVKSKNVARIQECHIFVGHFILNNVEKRLTLKY